ncbi:hypothetical protein CSUB_C0553 [Candidatus Caldarchaeum subterraneum]|uniref:Uncharacterized protein n=1 Tax=Caldiarchaeum subterraneum TaxID=311458 RepID=E6N5P7_CALS0|nr:hypothetical protein HGMM_F15C06C20 [Candidatus Caldarchaeum subterraneum]BAJ50413.1 hypothetical protein CSUB_C0553 [Candidatus Caldarchaeum subterraneum]
MLALLLALPTAFLGAAIVTPAFAQPNYTAWLKIVTASWDGAPYVAGAPPVQPTGVGFADRYNVTNVCVELYKFKNPSGASTAPLDSWEGPIRAGSPNGTGFIRVSWPAGWENVTIIVKAKSYQGECIGEGNPFRGIIVYWLTVNPTPSFLSKFGFSAFNSTINDDGIEDTHGGPFNWNIFPPLGSGPVDNVNYASGPITFQINHNDPQRAWLARAAYIFKLFHEHTWYATNDVLTYATIFIYDTDHTDASSTQSLIQAAITGDDGQSRYTREIYPRSAGVGSGKFAQNRLVPIPLQSINLGTREPFEGGIPDPEDNNGFIEAPHLNATKRVWWETVLVNQTFYVGNEYNQTGGPNAPEYATDPATGKIRPLFGAYPSNPSVNPTITQGGITGVPAGPFSLVLNETVYIDPPRPLLPTWEGTDTTANVETVGPSIANFENNTVFYARFCVQDADLAIQHPWIGDKMVGAEVTLNFKTSADVPYYLAHSIHTTGSDGCTNDPHKWPGYLGQYSKFARFPNGTNWGLRGSLNASYFFNPADDVSPAWRPGGYFEQAWGGSWQGPWINAGMNWSALIPEITYMKTRQLSDDPRWGGFEIQVKWKGGARNGYGGSAVLVDSVRVRNPYAIAATNTTTYNGWIVPNVVLGNNTVLIKIHNEVTVTLSRGPLGTPRPIRGPVTLMISSNTPIGMRLQNYNPLTGTFDIFVNYPPGVDLRVDIVENATHGGFIRTPFTFSGVIASIKYHDAATNQPIVGNISYALAGWQDIGPDGVIDSTSIRRFNVTTTGETGAAEVEIWPGPPGSQTIRTLVSSNNTDIQTLDPAFTYNDFVGGMLFSGQPQSGTFAILNATKRQVVILQSLAPHKAPDIALARAGLVYITANVHDLAYRLVDNLGNPAPAANTAITLQRGNGPPITKTGASLIPDFFPSTGSLQWSYDQHGEGWAVFYQLPEDLAYMVTVTFDGTPVGEATVDKLTHTIMEDLVLRIYKVKLVFVDCENSPLSREAFVKVVPPSPATPYVTQLDSTGALDFGYLAGGQYTIDGVWWKGVWVKFTDARIGDDTLPLNPDGSLTFTVDSNIDSPIKLTALINDFIFTTWDYNQDNRIPRLNITLTWVGVHPLTGSRLYFLETMDPTGDTNTDKFNTTLAFSQFFRYRIDHFFGGISRSNGLKTYGDVRYVFYKMPSALYNITVTTVTTGDPETQQTPGNSKWPGRTVPVDYEIKIDWTSHSSPPSIRKTPAGQVNDRVVLRVYMTWNGEFVTDPNLNPIGNATLYKTCGPVRIDLLTWAHTFKQRIVDGDFDYLNEARRIGNATYHIVNDNGVNMEMFIPEDGVFSSLFVSKWTEDTLLTTWLKADSQHSSNIWWNGTYRKQDLTFYSYVYPLEFTRGEQPWARFYDKAGLTGSGWLTTQKGPLTSPGGDVRPGDSFLIREFFNPAVNETANGKWPTHNFTVVGNEGLWNQQRWRWEQAVAAGAVEEISTPFKGKRYIEVPTRPTTLVFEKEVVTVPIPVGFITLNLKDEDLARPIPYAVVQLDVYYDDSGTVDRSSSVLYKTGRDGNLTLLYPTQEAMENILGTNVVNYTLTVYWYLNSSIVYKDAFNLTKRGYSVDKVAIADVTFVLAISANKDRPVKDLYARIWWLNVTDGNTVFPGRITVDHARRTWTYTAVPETRGAAKWTTGQLTLPWLPTSERFTKSDWDLVFDSSAGRWVYDDVTRSWDIPYPSYEDGRMIDGWPYNPVPTGYDRRHPHLTNQENSRIQYRISVWSDQLPIDPSSPKYNNGAWQRDHYELVWRIPAQFPDAWMLFGHPPFDITFYRGTTGTGQFQPIPGYALTRTWTATPTPGSKVVAIKLNATDVDIPVFWQVGDYELGSYDCGPLLGYIVKGRIVPPLGATFAPKPIDAVTTAGTITVGDKTVNICISGKPVGLVTVTSGDTPSTVIWGGSTLVIDEVSPPPSIWYNDGTGQAGADNPNRGTTSNYWRNWVSQAIDPLTGQPVNLHVGDQLQVPGVDLGIQYMGYGRPYEGVARTATVTVVSNDPDNRAHRPFIKMFEFQNVSARITDFNGRPLPGAFYQIIDAQTGKSAAWSYAGPDGRIVPMPIRKPGGVFIQRVLYLGQGANGEPTWPVNSFARWPIAYDSRDDETTQETQKPDIPLGFAYTAEAGPWPTGDGWFRADVCRHAGDGSYNYTAGVLEALASCPPAGWGRSFDVITRIFDLRIRFVYGDAQRPADPAYVFSAPSLALPDDFIIRGQGAIFEAKRLARSSYDIVALWPDANGEEVGRRTFDVSRTNVGTVEGTVVLALRDLSFNVVDRQGRPVAGARVSVSPNLVREQDIQLRPDSIFTILRVPDGRTYDFTVEWTSPYGTTARAAVRDTPAGLQSRGSIVIPVDDVTLTVVDFDGRPVAGAAIRFGGQQVGSTDSQGVVIIGQVPLDNEYQIEVSKDGTTIGGDRVRFTASRTSATIQAGIYDIAVIVKGAAGQPIQGAIVELVRGGTTIATAATDASGSAVFSKVVGADYSVRASYEQFSNSANVARGVRSATIVLDLYTILFGVPMTLATFLALIIGLILLVIVVVVIVSEYIRWRGRRLGIYPAAPPKK